MSDFDPFWRTRYILSQLKYALKEMEVESLEEAVENYKRMKKRLEELES